MPESLQVLRAAAVEDDVAWETKMSGAPDDLVSADAEIKYSIDYFDRYTYPGCGRDELRGFSPHLDFDYDQYTSARRNISSPVFYLVPALAWLNSNFRDQSGDRSSLNRGSSSDGSVDVVAWRNDLERRNPAASSIRRKLSALSSLFDYLCERNAVAGNPVEGVKRSMAFYDAAWQLCRMGVLRLSGGVPEVRLRPVPSQATAIR